MRLGGLPNGWPVSWGQRANVSFRLKGVVAVRGMRKDVAPIAVSCGVGLFRVSAICAVPANL